MMVKSIMARAHQTGTVVPAFNVPYLPMIEPVCRALSETGTFGLIAVARLEWIKFESKSQEAVAVEYRKYASEPHTRLHQDHVPVIDEDGLEVDFLADLKRALDLGYDSVMIDGSRLTLAENIRATRSVCEMAHELGVPVEGELGAVMGHESGPLPDYEDLFASGRGFTDPEEARTFVAETSVDWLSVAVGSVHGAISKATKDKQKIRARLNLPHLAQIQDATRVPLVLHGGSGIGIDDLRSSFQNGVSKINIATDIRQPYERAVETSIDAGREAVYEAVKEILTRLGVSGSAATLGT
jgi:ketose-bisphosphate aldolase